jgi:RNA polymerase sigma-70 factor (ECF subfamily)
LILREVEDRDLILRARRGDVDAYNVLVSHWEKRVYNYLLRTVRNREDAMDLSQETFLKAYRHLPRLEAVERFPQWLFRIAHNEAISLYRRNRFAADGEVPEESVGATVSVGGAALRPMELTLAVERALDGLSAEQREALILKVYQGFKFEEIAAILGSPASTIKSRVYTALDLLKKSLAPARDHDSSGVDSSRR